MEANRARIDWFLCAAYWPAQPAVKVWVGWVFLACVVAGALGRHRRAVSISASVAPLDLAHASAAAAEYLAT